MRNPNLLLVAAFLLCPSCSYKTASPSQLVGPFTVSYKLRTSSTSTAGNTLTADRIVFHENFVVVHVGEIGTVLPCANLVSFTWVKKKT